MKFNPTSRKMSSQSRVSPRLTGDYTRREALDVLNKAENKMDDAVSALQVIVDSLEPKESLQKATDGFVKVLKAFGNDSTQEAKKAYEAVDARVKKGENRSEALQSFAALVDSENRKEDAFGNFRTVSHAVDKGLEREASTDTFVATLNTVSAKKTDEARTVFSKAVNALRPEDSLPEILNGFSLLHGLENSVEDAVEGFNLVIQNRQPAEPYSQVNESYVSLLKKYDADNTSSVKSAFRHISNRVESGQSRTELTNALVAHLDVVGASKGALGSFQIVSDNLRDGESLDSAIAGLHSLVAVENGVEDAASLYRLVDSGLQESETRTSAIETMAALAGTIGPKNTSDTKSAYSSIQRRVEAGEDRAKTTQEFLKTSRLENGRDDSLSAFRAINKAVDKGLSRQEASDGFNQLLTTFGNEESKHVKSQFQMVVNSLRSGENFSGAIQTVKSVFAAENGFDDTASCYRAIDSAVTEKVTRAEATEYFISLLTEHGNDKTKKAISVFKKSHGLILGQ